MLLFPPAFAFSRCLNLNPTCVSIPLLVKPDMRILRIRLTDENMPSPTAGVSSSAPDVPDHTHDVICRLRNVRISQSSPCASDSATLAAVYSRFAQLRSRRDWPDHYRNSSTNWLKLTLCRFQSLNHVLFWNWQWFCNSERPLNRTTTVSLCTFSPTCTAAVTASDGSKSGLFV